MKLIVIRDEEKNAKVKKRIGWTGVWFEDVKVHLQQNKNYRLLKNPRYEGQMSLIILIEDYPYEIPCKWVWPNTLKLITMFPNRNLKPYVKSLQKRD